MTPSPHQESVKLPDHIESFLEHLIGCGNDAGTGRIGLLGHDQFCKFVGNIGVRTLKRLTANRPLGAKNGCAAIQGRCKCTAIKLLQGIIRVETRQCNFRDRKRLAICVGGRQSPTVSKRYSNKLNRFGTGR